MKKILCFLLLVLMISSCEEVPEWDEMEHIYYNGDIDLTFASQSNLLDDLIAMGYNAIDGNLSLIGGYSGSDLEFLDQLYVITGSLSMTKVRKKDLFGNLIEIGENLNITSMKEIDDFPKLVSVKNITIKDSYFLAIEGFERLDSCKKLEIKDHIGQVNSFNAFPSLIKTDTLYLNLNQRTDSKFSGLENLIYCKDLKLENVGMNALESLEIIENRLEINGTLGDNSLKSCFGADTLIFRAATALSNQIFTNPFASSVLDIVDCQDIEDLEWTTMMDSVVQCRIIDCNYLLSLDGLEKQFQLDTMVCSQNDSLRNYCSISDLDIIDGMYIRFNYYNPTWLEIQSGICEPEEE